MPKDQKSAVQEKLPLTLDASGNLAPLCERLKQAGFLAPALAQTLGIHTPGEMLNVAVVLRRTEAPTDYNTLVRLFILGQIVAEASVARALGPAWLRTLLKVGLLRATKRGVRSLGRLGPFEDLYCLSDFTHPGSAKPPAMGHVLGVSPSSVSLANLTVRRRQESMFDLGTGCGIQALLAAKHVARVVGSDVNLRALNFAAFNARLNSFDNLEWRAGSFFDAVPGEQFDLVVANPPFVISPDAALLYRDGGLAGDHVSEQVVQGATMCLKEGGYASILLNWHHATETDWHERPWAWLTESGCDGWLLRFSDQDPLTYAARWLAQTHRPDTPSYGRLLERWLKYYADLGIQRIAFGQLTLRRRTGQANWFRCDTLAEIQGVCPCGDQIQRIFAAEDFLNGLGSDEEFMAQRLALSPEVVLEQRLATRDAGWVSEAITLRLTRGLPFRGNVDPALLRLINGCDGKKPLGELIKAMVEGTGANAQTVRQQCLEAAKHLVRGGMLVAGPCLTVKSLNSKFST